MVKRRRKKLRLLLFNLVKTPKKRFVRPSVPERSTILLIDSSRVTFISQSREISLSSDPKTLLNGVVKTLQSA
jgi:hypothetical protein